MSAQAAIYDLTIIDADGNALFGTFSGGSITESDFQTPDPSKSHDRTWLEVPENLTGPRVDFVNGSSRIGAVTVTVGDVRGTATDQTTGQLTAKIDQAVGQRAVLRRWDETNTQWIVLMDGVVHTYSVDSSRLVAYNLHLRDGREFERNGELFSSNFVLWGEDGKQGPPINYGKYPANEIDGNFEGFMLDKVGPYDSVSVGDLDHFRSHTGADPTDGIHFGFVAVTADSGDLKLPDLGWPTQRTDGLYYYEDIRVRWRAKGSGDDWTVLTEMPASVYQNVVESARAIYRRDDGTDEAYPANGLYMASTDSSELPTDRQEIEFQVLAERITEDTPFFWDGGTLGDLLQEIVDGDHTDNVPQEQYDTSALTTFRSTSPKARFILKEPVKDRRKWVEENIYKAALVAPAFNASQEIYPASWELPDNTETISEINASNDDIQPIGEWEHGGENSIGRVEYTYIREHMDPIDTIMQTRKIDKRWWFDDEITERVVDPEDDRAPWQRLTETEVTQSQSSDDAAPGAKTLTYAPITIRSIAGVDGSPVFGDVQDELGNRLFRKAAESVLPRFKTGAPRFIVDVVATDANLAHKTGDWLLVNAEWIPEYSTGKREFRGYMQIYAISDVDPSKRKFYLVSGNIPAPEDPDDTTVADCITGGTTVAGPNNDSIIEFTSDGDLVNTCGEDVTLPELLLIAGGGGGNGKGGGAGEVTNPTDVVIAAGETIPITIGAAGSAGGGGGGDTIVWLDVNDGTALDPDTDNPPATSTGLRARGGNTRFTGQGYSGSGNSGGGSCTCTGSCSASGEGGGGGQNSVGADGSCNCPDCKTFGGAGGAAVTYPDFGVTVGAGGGGDGTETDLPSGAYPGGGGAGSGSAGKAGAFFVRHESVPTLSAPTISSTSTTTENQNKICVEGSNFPTATPPGYRVRVEYAFTASDASEPASTSGDWQLAGYLEAEGCVTTDAVPTGAKIWHRVRAESDDQLPSDWGTTGSDTTTETAALLKLSLSLDDEAPASATLSWQENSFAESIRIRGKVHDSDDDVTPDLTQLDEVSAQDQTYAVTPTVGEGRFLTVDMVCFDGVDWGYATAVGDDSPLQYLRLGESSGTTATDETANNNDGTYNGDPTLGTTGLLTEDSNTAVALDGTGDYIDVGTLGTIGSDGTRTFEFWYKGAESGQARFFGTVADGSNTYVELTANKEADGTNTAGHTVFRVRDESGRQRDESWDDQTVDIYDGNTHHIVIVQDSHTDWRIYVDGTEVSTTVVTAGGTYADPADWQYPLAVGARNVRGTVGNELTGAIDEWAVYDTALTEGRVQAHYNIGTAADDSELAVAGTEGKTHRVSIEHVAETLADRDDLADDLGEVVVDKNLDDVLDKNLDQIRSHS